MFTLTLFYTGGKSHVIRIDGYWRAIDAYEFAVQPGEGNNVIMAVLEGEL